MSVNASLFKHTLTCANSPADAVVLRPASLPLAFSSSTVLYEYLGFFFPTEAAGSLRHWPSSFRNSYTGINWEYNVKIMLTDSTMSPLLYNLIVGVAGKRGKDIFFYNTLPFPPLPLSRSQGNPEDSVGFAHCHKHPLLPCLYEPLPQWGL